jgi:acetyl-CoA carboxylase biotin carboxyl carrier protein
MDIRKIKKLMELVEQSGINELEVREGEESIRLSKAPAGVMMSAVAAPVAAPLPVVAAPVPVVAPALPAGHVMTAPMVGTFYRASSPGAKPFAEVGDAVKAGQPVCIIEAMKIMNEIESDQDGTITKILVENGQPVEYGQPLFVVE